MQRDPLILIEALDAGAWGNRVAIAVQDESPGLVSSTRVIAVIGTTQLQLSSLTGIEAGTYLEMFSPAGVLVQPYTPLTVSAVNLSTTTITLDNALTAAQLTAIGLATATAPVILRSREFRISVYLYRHPDAVGALTQHAGDPVRGVRQSLDGLAAQPLLPDGDRLHHRPEKAIRRPAARRFMADPHSGHRDHSGGDATAAPGTGGADRCAAQWPAKTRAAQVARRRRTRWRRSTTTCISATMTPIRSTAPASTRCSMCRKSASSRPRTR